MPEGGAEGELVPLGLTRSSPVEQTPRTGQSLLEQRLGIGRLALHLVLYGQIVDAQEGVGVGVAKGLAAPGQGLLQ